MVKGSPTHPAVKPFIWVHPCAIHWSKVLYPFSNMVHEVHCYNLCMYESKIVLAAVNVSTTNLYNVPVWLKGSLVLGELMPSASVVPYHLLLMALVTLAIVQW